MANVPCPACDGEGGFDVSHLDEPLRRLARLFGAELEPMCWAQCDICEGAGKTSPETARDYRAWMTAKMDQALAEYDARR